MRTSILVIREYDRFSAVLEENNFEVVNLPLIETIPAKDLRVFDEKLENLETYDGIFLTSPNAAQIFLEKCREKNLSFGGKIYVLGARNFTLFENSDFKIVFRNDANTADELINSFPQEEFANKKFLFPRGSKSVGTIQKLLKNSADIDEAIVYQTTDKTVDEELKTQIRRKIESGEIVCVCFFSPSGFENFAKNFNLNLLKKIKITAIGATTAGKIAENELKTDFVSPKASAEDFAENLVKYLKEAEEK